MENLKIERLTMNVAEMAGVLGISKPKAYELVNRSDFPVIRVGKRLVIPLEPFKKWMDTAAKAQNV